MGHSGERHKFIKYIIKLLHWKKSEKKNPIKNKPNKTEITKKKIRRNRFGFPVYY